MGRSPYQSEKRRKELARLKKQEEKRQRRFNKKNGGKVRGSRARLTKRRQRARRRTGPPLLRKRLRETRKPNHPPDFCLNGDAAFPVIGSDGCGLPALPIHATAWILLLRGFLPPALVDPTIRFLHSRLGFPAQPAFKLQCPCAHLNHAGRHSKARCGLPGNHRGSR